MIFDLLQPIFPWLVTAFMAVIAYFSFKINSENKAEMRQMGVELEKERQANQDEVNKLTKRNEIDTDINRMSDDAAINELRSNFSRD